MKSTMLFQTLDVASPAAFQPSPMNWATALSAFSTRPMIQFHASDMVVTMLFQMPTVKLTMAFQASEMAVATVVTALSTTLVIAFQASVKMSVTVLHKVLKSSDSGSQLTQIS